jgi:hypothetical protein
MFTILTEPLRTVDCLGCWARHTDRFTLVSGYTAFGDVFLLDPSNNEFAVLCPMLGQQFPTGCYGKDRFENQFLTDLGIVNEFGRPNDIEQLKWRLGPLKGAEVYFPVPYPIIGGSGELSTYEKGNVWVFVHLVGLMHGLDQPGKLTVEIESLR